VRPGCGIGMRCDSGGDDGEFGKARTTTGEVGVVGAGREQQRGRLDDDNVAMAEQW
jgi:hypothetical protein